MSDDDDVSLRPDTLAALQAFLREKKEAEKAIENEATDTAHATLVAQEDWQLSQFWYDDDTARKLAQEVLAAAADARRDAAGEGAGSSASGAPAGSAAGATIACISCPSTYKGLLAVGIPDGVSVSILEYDRRFSVFGDAFAFYDYNRPHEFPAALRGTCDLIILDPPFINPDCLAGFAETVAAMRRGPHTRVLLCTGSVMVPHAARLLGARPTRFHVGHANRLSNPFTLYASYESDRLGGFDTDAEAAAARDA